MYCFNFLAFSCFKTVLSTILSIIIFSIFLFSKIEFSIFMICSPFQIIDLTTFTTITTVLINKLTEPPLYILYKYNNELNFFYPPSWLGWKYYSIITFYFSLYSSRIKTI